MTLVAHFPASIDKGWLEKLRRPLSAAAATILVVDLMVLGTHLADSATSRFADDSPTHARARIGGPEALVPSTGVTVGTGSYQAAEPAEPLGCLARNSGCYVAPPTPTAPSNAGGATPPATGGTGKTPAPTPPAPPKPLAQADVGVPAIGAQVSLGVGDGGCTGLTLTVLAVGDCPVASGDAPVTVNVGGSLLGE